MQITIEATELARILGNAIAFIPARSLIKTARLVFTKERLIAEGTDGYAAGSDWALIESSKVPEGEYVELLIERGSAPSGDKPGSGIALLESVARKEGKKYPATLSIGDQLTLDVQGEKATVAIANNGHDEGVYSALAEVFGSAEKREAAIPGVVCFDPALLSRFTKVKADKTERMADFLMSDTHGPVLVKIGPSFRGLIMPIDREDHANKQGPEGLW